MRDNKTVQASVRLPANIMKELRVAVALRETTIQRVLEQAVRVYLASSQVANKM